ncbi:DUF2243 domain-containing protein [Rhodopseudomonas palustris]|uniref:DUF2243 domain-containing protein n=1 Tax=Rhodopseudomonas palustris TaxID=1076 RepID=A0A418VHA7_RHOPL|nr:DUF2243 domain-containing protein [Rhodopseudomonas palustris]RJF75508.1 DUF2243 domain-containing protein [Rhodopseudomonas palustris]
MKRAGMVADTYPFPASAGVLFGLGLGGFFDGIVLHQLLQWHHMLSGWYPVNTLDNLALNTTWDGIFHSLTYLFLVGGLFVAWRASQRARLRWSSVRFVGLLLIGWGLFNVVEGVIDHQILGIHRVNETVPEAQRIYWDIGVLAWGAAMLVGGWLMARSHAGPGSADLVSRPQ